MTVLASSGQPYKVSLFYALFFSIFLFVFLAMLTTLAQGRLHAHRCGIARLREAGGKRSHCPIPHNGDPPDRSGLRAYRCGEKGVCMP